MYPTLQEGDLVLLRTASEYAVGDIVVYREPSIGPVIHRIIEKTKEGCFLMQGDHNTFVDPYCPTRADIIARYWVHIPKLGTYVKQLQSPGNMAAVAGLLGVTIMSIVTNPNQRSGTKPSRRHPVSSGGGPSLPELLVIVGVVCALFLGLAGYAFTRPLERLVSRGLDYQHRGEFTYTAHAPADIYDAGLVRSGDPVFRKVVDRLQIGFTYQLTAAQPSVVGGTYRLSVEMTSSDGWKRTFELQPETPFEGASFSVTDELALSELQAVIDTLELGVGVHQKSYTVTFLPEVKVAGRIGLHFLADSFFAPRIPFELTEQQFRLIRSGGDDPLVPVVSASIAYASSEPNTITFLKKTFYVSALRSVAAVGTVISLVGVGVLVISALRTAGSDAASRVQQKYGALLVAIEDVTSLLGDAHTIAVASIDDLARIAEQAGTMIMCHSHDAWHDYYVQTDRAIFRHRLDERAAPHLAGRRLAADQHE